MKKLIALAAAGMLAGCGGSADEAEEVAVEEPTMEVGEATGTPAGTYEVSMADGTMVTQTINADGTYSHIANGAEVERGTWRTDAEKLCYDPEGDAPEACYTGDDPAADGSFTVRDAAGNVAMTVRKVDVSAEGTAPMAQ